MELMKTVLLWDLDIVITPDGLKGFSHLYTDASIEGGIIRIGAFLYQKGLPPRFFGLEVANVPADMHGFEIQAAEALAAHLGLKVFKDDLRGTQVIGHVDS